MKRGEQTMVPRASFSSYYGRPVLKKPVWRELDIAGYFFTGGIAAGSALLAAGADLTDRPTLRRNSRLTTVAALGVSAAALVHDLGVPTRFHHMLRVLKPTSPMSVGSWFLTVFAAPASVTAVAELPGLLPRGLRAPLAAVARPAGLAAAAVAPAIATYTAVLVSDTAVPAWHAAHRELPFVFAGSALAGSAGLSLMTTPLRENAPVARMAVVGAVLELAASQRMERRLGFVGEPYRDGSAGRKLRASKVLTAVGAATALLGRRRRPAALAAGVALVAASALTRFGVFEAGVASAEDPAYVVSPQRERLEAARAGAVDNVSK
ncbi:MAG: hypothetical protein QOJ03_2236 [Frankiaceae bacterium]|nr:hypothetical protein [Frankiaceae bacterium]